MQWAFRWYGDKDSVPLNYYRQVPGIDGVVATLLNKNPGDVWQISEIEALKQKVEKENLKLLGIESVAVHDEIKAGGPKRDYYIENYKETIKNLGKCGIKLVCYSFKPVFGWAKTNLHYPNEDGSYSLVFDQATIENMEAKDMFKLINSQSGNYRLPGWEKAKEEQCEKLLSMYKDIDEETLFNNLSYFLKAIIPTCEKYDVKMAIHPDDPPWEIFGLPRITKNINDYQKIIDIVDSKYNGITLCTGSLGANKETNLIDFIERFKDRIHFVHMRNIKYLTNDKFKECAHISSSGDFDMAELMTALIKNNFDGVIRPDHGRAIWDEDAMPGYGLYDRALGFTYLKGLYEGIKKSINSK